jgi:2'-5' RNA ligase
VTAREAASAFIVRVPEAERCVGALRERYDPSVKLGVPAHITLLVPFMAPERIDDQVLRRAQAALDVVPSFHFSLSQVARFPATAYLAPEPAEPFIALTRSLVRSFPDYPPFGGEHDSIVPHLTVAHGSAAEAEVAARELAAAVQAHGPIHGRCTEVTLLENSSGQWKPMRVFALPGAGLDPWLGPDHRPGG